MVFTSDDDSQSDDEDPPDTGHDDLSGRMRQTDGARPAGGRGRSIWLACFPRGTVSAGYPPHSRAESGQPAAVKSLRDRSKKRPNHPGSTSARRRLDLLVLLGSTGWHVANGAAAVIR